MPMWFNPDTRKVMALVLRLLVPLFLSRLFSLPLMPRETPEIHTFPFWHHFQLDSRCSWFIWPPSQLLEQESTLLGALELLSSSTKTRHGMTMGSFGLDHSLELHLLQFTTR